VCAMASQLQDSYCSLAWGKTLAADAGAAAAAAVLRDGDDTAPTARDRALAAWARKVVADPNSTTSSDVDMLRQAGLDDRAIFEATVFIAFRLAFSTVNDALGANPDWQLADTAPPEVRAAVSYGRRPLTAPEARH
jgi:alkylhydroperoxidase family enzyme